MPYSLLIICNGHGEDVIALEIIKRLSKKTNIKKIEVMPLVGKGDVFNNLESKKTQKIGHRRVLPSGGFSNQSLKGFIFDFFSGFLIDIFRNFLIVKQKSKLNYKIIAIGDLLPLFFAWSSKCEFSFIGTPKSDYTWNSGPGWKLSDLYHKFKGSEWDPWEILLMRSHKCKSLIMRDEMTAFNLNKKRINARYFGNPMMDFVLEKSEKITNIVNFNRIVLLIGSRYPEALSNLESFLDCLEDFIFEKDLIILLPLSANSDISKVQKYLKKYHYMRQDRSTFLIDEDSVWKNKNKFILLGKNTFNIWANMADVAISNAGTATEQIAGLGIPSISLPGKGPQFTRAFARRQSRLLGGSVLVCDNKKDLLNHLKMFLCSKKYRSKEIKVGKKRMGTKGASQKIVDYISLNLLA